MLGGGRGADPYRVSTPTFTKSSTAFYVQAVIAFAAAIFTVLVGIYFLPVDPWIRAFLCLGTLYLTTSAFTLAKVLRDRQESEAVVQRIDEARVDKLLAEHDPFKLRPSSSMAAPAPAGPPSQPLSL